nr:MAG TPA: Protein of unknown function (DUF739) [Caudoviricetes sp.]
MTAVEINYSDLRRLIKYKYDNEANFADHITMSRVSLNKKLNNVVGFTTAEILEISEKLGISKDEISRYFFTPALKIS